MSTTEDIVLNVQRKRILITPGIVDLGDKANEINKELNTGIYINSILTAPIDYTIQESLNTNIQGE